MSGTLRPLLPWFSGGGAATVLGYAGLQLGEPLSAPLLWVAGIPLFVGGLIVVAGALAAAGVRLYRVRRVGAGGPDGTA